MTQRITPRYMHLAGSVVVALAQGTTDTPQSVESVENKLTVVPYYWNPDTLAYEVARQVATAGSTGGGGGSTAVDATLTSGGSTRLVGQVTVANPTTSVSLSSQATVTVGNPTTSVTITSGVVLGPSTAFTGLISSGTQTIGTVLNATSTSQIGSVALVTGTTGTMGAMAQGPGSSANVWVTDAYAFTSGQTSRSSVSTTVDTQIVAANANRKALVVANRSTAQTVGIGFSTAALTTALANVDLFIPPSQHISFGFQGTLPLYLGPLRGINLTSTAVGGSVAVTQFLNT